MTATPRIADATPGPPPATIADFITDASLAVLCSELSAAHGVLVGLLDAEGRLITADPSGSPPWRADAAPAGPPSFLAPIRADGRDIGSLAVWSDRPPDHGLARILGLLASTVAEVCQRETELRHRLAEVRVLYKLSSLLARASGVDEVLGIGLDSALEVLELDAGSLWLLAEKSDGVLGASEEDLDLQVSRGLSASWLKNPAPLSANRVFDRLALSGEVVAVPDISADPRVTLRDRAAAEGLGAFLSAGLIFRDRPVGVIRLYARRPRAFTAPERRLVQSIGQQMAVAVEQARLIRVQAEDRRIQRQLRLAADVQRRMLPRSAPRSAVFDVAARWTPSLELGGDFFDFVDVGGGAHSGLGVVVGDVVGKGIAAALLMASVRAGLRSHCSKDRGPDVVLSMVNRDLCRDTLPSEFATIWFGVLDPATLTLRYASAGHDPPMVVRLNSGVGEMPAPEVVELRDGGLVAGVDEGQVYTSSGHALRPGDVLAVFTDGLVDARDFSGERFGRDRVRRALVTALWQDQRAGAQAILDHVFWELRQFCGLAARPDDQTMVVVRVRDGAPAA